MPRISKSIAKEFSKKISALETTRKRIEFLGHRNLIPKKDKYRVYESIFLNSIVAFESLIEQLFIGLLVSGRGLVSSRSDISPRIQIQSHKVAFEVVIGNNSRKYITWLPYENTKRLANIFFTGGRPFTDLSLQDENIIDQALIIRNAIAHSSSYAKSRFLEKVIGSKHVLPREKNASVYLQGIFRASPNQTRYENLVFELVRIANFLTK